MENEALLRAIYYHLQELRTKFSLADNIAQIKNARFYLPNYPKDCIQKCIVDGNDYWDRQALDIINKYLKDNSTILDIGANIGSHSLYWAIERNAKKIYSFEPLVSTFEILKKNVELNNLQEIIQIYNVGLSDEETNAGVKSYTLDNIGSTSFEKSENGIFKLITLDSMEIKDKIDLIKIDVEGAEVEVLIGAMKTIRKNKPIIVIESFHRKIEIDVIFNKLGYKQVDTIREGEDYIYKYFGE